MSETKKQAVKNQFINGFKGSSFLLNIKASTADSRKYISILRREGMSIVDQTINPGNYKLYWLNKNIEVNTLPQ